MTEIAIVALLILAIGCFAWCLIAEEDELVRCEQCRHFAKYGAFECCEVRPASGRFEVPRDGYCHLAEREEK